MSSKGYIRLCISVALLLLVTFSAIFIPTILSNEDVVSAEVVSQNASETIKRIGNAHMRIINTEYNEGKPSIITKEDVWMDYPDKLLSTSEEIDPMAGESRGTNSIMKFNGKDLVVLSINQEGNCSFAQLVRNIIRFPSGDFGGYPTYCTYGAPIDSLLLDTSNFVVVGREKVDQKDAVKVKLLNKEGTSEKAEVSVTKFKYLDPETSIVLKEEMYANDQLLKRIEVESVETNVEIDEGMFEYELPSGLSVAAGTLYLSDAGYTVLSNVEELAKKIPYGYVLPTYLPEGYKLSEVGYVDNSKLITNGQPDSPNPVWTEPSFFTYSDGSDYIYIAEDSLSKNQKGDATGVTGIPPYALKEVELSNGRAYHYSRGARSGTLYFEAGGVKVRITGSASLDELKKVAQSLIEGS